MPSGPAHWIACMSYMKALPLWKCRLQHCCGPDYPIIAWLIEISHLIGQSVIGHRRCYKTWLKRNLAGSCDCDPPMQFGPLISARDQRSRWNRHIAIAKKWRLYPLVSPMRYSDAIWSQSLIGDVLCLLISLPLRPADPIIGDRWSAVSCVACHYLPMSIAICR